MRDKSVETAKLRPNFHRDNYRRVVAVLIFFLVVNVVLVCGLVYMVLTPEDQAFYATMNDGKVSQLFPLEEPNLPQTAVLQWSNQAAIAVYTIDFINYVSQLRAAARYFTEAGWAAFKETVKKTAIPEVQAKQLVVTAVATAAPIILEEGNLNGRYTWKVEIPMLVSYQGASGDPVKQAVDVVMTVVRVNTHHNPKGIGIVQFNARA